MESCTNYELQLLVNKLNSSNIPAKGTGYNELEIFYNESNKNIVLSLLSTIKNSKTGYKFKKIKDNKSVTINFGSRININVEYLTKLLNTTIPTDTTNYTIIDNILDNYSVDNIDLSIQENMEYKNNYLVTISEILDKEDTENNNTYVVNNNLTNNIIHTIVRPEPNNKYKITYRLLYSDINTLSSLLTYDVKIKRLYNDQVKSL
ncbi:MAG: hypothetical protein MR550_01145 [Bacilli bacterium]|nr:hypothetical protein [Bacilli bacterium]